jgi:hypothetical protein
MNYLGNSIHRSERQTRRNMKIWKKKKTAVNEREVRITRIWEQFKALTFE